MRKIVGMVLGVSLFVFVSGFFQPLQLLSADKIVVVATDAGWPPMEMEDKDGAIVGFGVDIMNAIGKESGFSVQFKKVAWDDIFTGLDKGEYDAICSSVSITDERKQKYDFSEPYFNAGQILVVPNQLKNISLAGKTVGALSGSTGLDFIVQEKGLKIVQYENIDMAFVDMYEGKIQGVICDSPVAANYCLLMDKYKGMFAMLGAPFTKEYYGIVVKKGNSELLNLINNGLSSLQKKGIDNELKQKWLMQ